MMGFLRGPLLRRAHSLPHRPMFVLAFVLINVIALAVIVTAMHRAPEGYGRDRFPSHQTATSLIADCGLRKEFSSAIRNSKPTHEFSSFRFPKSEIRNRKRPSPFATAMPSRTCL